MMVTIIAMCKGGHGVLTNEQRRKKKKNSGHTNTHPFRDMMAVISMDPQ